MCGFAGVVAWDERYRIDRQTLARMSAAVTHRGPDGEGVYFNHESGITADRPVCALAFRRLAVLDPADRSNQPFTIDHRTIVFNGEIYNYRELRKELTQLKPDYAWRTTGDTEVLLTAFDVWGERCVEHLNGMFAFAVWNDHEKSLFLARDRMGQKPLYFSELPGVIAFASEPPALSPLAWVDRHPDPLAVSQFLRFGCNTSTVFPSICQLPPGTTRRGKLTSRYFDLGTVPATRLSDRECVAETRTRTVRAVQRQLVSDVPLGVFLSGGIDSSVIAACARQFGPVKTFSIAFDDPRYDETEYAQAVARHLGCEHHVFRVTPRAAEDLPMLAALFGTPFADSSALPTHYLSRETRKHVTVALSGDGGDELFGGYERYRALSLEQTIRLIPGSIRGSLAGPWLDGLPGIHPKSIGSKAKRFLRSINQPPARRYAGYLRLFDDEAIAELWHEPIDLPPDPVEEAFSAIERDADAVRAALAADRSVYLPDDLLAKVDRCSMLHGLEVRSPFMDHEVVQFAAGLTTAQLMKGGPKRMLREAFARDLPGFVFKRIKMGFAVPIGEWFRGELRGMLRDHLFADDSFASAHFNRAVVERMVNEHEWRRVDHSQRLYALLMLELWWKVARAAHVARAARP